MSKLLITLDGKKVVCCSRGSQPNSELMKLRNVCHHKHQSLARTLQTGGSTHSQTTIRYPFSTPPHRLQLCNSIIYGHNVWKNKHAFCSVNLYYSSELTAHLLNVITHSYCWYIATCCVLCDVHSTPSSACLIHSLSDSGIYSWDYTSTPFTPLAVYCSLSDTLFDACTHYDWVMSPTTR